MLLTVICYCLWPIVVIVAAVAPMGHPAPDDPQPDVNPAYPEVYLLWAAAVVLPVVGTVSLLARERWLRRNVFGTA